MKVKTLPLEEAVKLEAAQNIQRDERLFPEIYDYVRSSLPKRELVEIYEREAKRQLMENGVGLNPECEDHFLIKVQ